MTFLYIILLAKQYNLYNTQQSYLGLHKYQNVQGMFRISIHSLSFNCVVIMILETNCLNLKSFVQN